MAAGKGIASQLRDPGLKDLDLDAPQYDQHTYFGRVMHFRDVTDFRTLFTTPLQLENARQLLSDFRQGRAVRATRDELLYAKKLEDAMVHPDTGEIIFAPFRISAMVPLNILLCVGLMNASTVPSTVFWQGINQTLNIGTTFANRNASNYMSTRDLLVAYAGSLGASVGTAVGLGQFVKHSQGPWAPTIRRFIPFTAVALANVVNTVLMRHNEATDGVTVRDIHGDAHGESPTAGKYALAQTITSRVVNAAPAMVIPPLILARLPKRIQSNPRVYQACNIGLIAACIYVVLPMSFGIFSHKAEVAVKKLEPRFHNLIDRDGNRIEHLYYNKGL